MNQEPNTPDQQHLFKMIEGFKYAMLTTVDEDGTLRSRPMANQQAEKFEGVMWFFTRASAHKVDEVNREHQVNISFADEGKQSYVSVSGTAEMLRDQGKIDELWTPYIKIWFPEGKDGPDVTLLKVTIGKAEYWDGPSSKMVQLYGMAKAAVTGNRDAISAEDKKISFA